MRSRTLLFNWIPMNINDHLQPSTSLWMVSGFLFTTVLSFFFLALMFCLHIFRVEVSAHWHLVRCYSVCTLLHISCTCLRCNFGFKFNQCQWLKKTQPLLLVRIYVYSKIMYRWLSSSKSDNRIFEDLTRRKTSRRVSRSFNSI